MCRVAVRNKKVSKIAKVVALEAEIPVKIKAIALSAIAGGCRSRRAGGHQVL